MPKSQILSFLKARELGLEAQDTRRPFNCVPESQIIPVESVLDEDERLKDCVILGFTRDGDHLLSYTLTSCAASGFDDWPCLQVWTFKAGRACKKVYNIGLFRDSDSAYVDWDEVLEVNFAGLNNEYMTCQLTITAFETPCEDMLVVHGLFGRDFSTLLRQAYTVIPGIRHHPQELHVCHFASLESIVEPSTLAKVTRQSPVKRRFVAPAGLLTSFTEMQNYVHLTAAIGTERELRATSEEIKAAQKALDEAAAKKWEFPESPDASSGQPDAETPRRRQECNLSGPGEDAGETLDCSGGKTTTEDPWDPIDALRPVTEERAFTLLQGQVWVKNRCLLGGSSKVAYCAAWTAKKPMFNTEHVIAAAISRYLGGRPWPGWTYRHYKVEVLSTAPPDRNTTGERVTKLGSFVVLICALLRVADIAQGEFRMTQSGTVGFQSQQPIQKRLFLIVASYDLQKGNVHILHVEEFLDPETTSSVLGGIPVGEILRGRKGLSWAEAAYADRSCERWARLLLEKCWPPGNRQAEQAIFSMSNTKVLETGKSVKYVAHPILPLCLKGYRIWGSTGA